MFNLSDGINALEYHVMRESELLDAFQQAYKSNPSRDPADILTEATRRTGFRLSELSCCEIRQLQDKINRIIHS